MKIWIKSGFYFVLFVQRMRPLRLKFPPLSGRHGGHASPSLSRLCCHSSCCQFEQCLPPNIIGFSPSPPPGPAGGGEFSTAHLERRGAGLHKNPLLRVSRRLCGIPKKVLVSLIIPGWRDSGRVSRIVHWLRICLRGMSHACRRGSVLTTVLFQRV